MGLSPALRRAVTSRTPPTRAFALAMVAMVGWGGAPASGRAAARNPGPELFTRQRYADLRKVQIAHEPHAVPGPERPPWGHPSRIGARVVERGDGSFWALGGYDARGRPTRRTWRFNPEPFERRLREPARHPGGFWTEGPRMHFPRAYPAAALLPDGRVLVAGGFGPDGQPLRTAEVLDPVNGTTRHVSRMVRARAGAAAIRLRSGRILLVGGYRKKGRPTSTLETFSPDTMHFYPHPWRLPEGVAWPAVARLNDGDVLISGGWTGSRVSERITLFDDIGGPVGRNQGIHRHPWARGGLRDVGVLAGPRCGHRMRTIGEVVLIAGGYLEEPCKQARKADPPEVWDTARPGPTSAFEPVGPLDARRPRRLPYRHGEARYLVGTERPDCDDCPYCPDTPEEPPVPMLPCWIFPSDARGPFDGRGPAVIRPLPEPRDRTWPLPGTSRDPRPCPEPPGYDAVPLPPKETQ